MIEGIGKAYKKEKEVENFKKENYALIADLAQAYITSRYLPAEFNPRQTKTMKNFVEKLINFLKGL